MQTFHRTYNGHQMEISFFTDQGGGIEEVSFWCHTCDQEGSNTTVWDVQTNSLTVATGLAIIHSAEHAGEQI